MATSPSVYIGIDPTDGERIVTLAVLDHTLHILNLSTEPLEAVVEHIAAYPRAVCAIGAPCGPNAGLMRQSSYRKRLGLAPSQKTYVNYRVAEYELRRRGIYITNTDFRQDRLSDWVHDGWKLYERLREQGYEDYPSVGDKRLFETVPSAAFTVLIGQWPYPKPRLEGILQRQLILFDLGINVPDPMSLLEEFTEHRLRTGQLKFNTIYQPGQLDALVAAYCSYMLDQRPEQVLAVGDTTEGQILLPTRQLKDFYS
nr:DUF429 domain-containing protein [Anaerolineae bacterium]